ncbi:MAG TPA: SDR family oxidoreductase [Blastocatellia bacterium]|jgi:NAD(P)-dependent dehydrogenase (short-subunit alcohol dehydrogenase family)|nr:SDR family oxidoreductase [Blastocatellia bacterium]
MKLKDKVAIVTGGAHGIGKALSERFALEGARVVVADLDAEAASQVAQQIAGLAVTTNVAREADIVNLVQKANEAYGAIDLFCSNAGIGTPGGADEPNEIWQNIWEVNVMAHIYAARAVVPQMLARGEGYLLNTASAAGLLAQIGSAPYSVTKHAAVSFAEWLSITHGDRGIRVSCLCPQGVNTDLLRRSAGAPGQFLRAGMLEPEQVADCVVKGLEEERFLILPHPEVAEYMRRKATDYDRWLRGMRRLQASFDSPTSS